MFEEIQSKIRQEAKELEWSPRDTQVLIEMRAYPYEYKGRQIGIKQLARERWSFKVFGGTCAWCKMVFYNSREEAEKGAEYFIDNKKFTHQGQRKQSKIISNAKLLKKL